jgi:Short C-terminal domain
MPPMASRLSMGGGSGPREQATLAGHAYEAFNTALGAVAAEGGQVTWQNPPQAARFSLPYKSFWYTLNMTVRYDGDFTITPVGNGQSTLNVGAKLDMGSAGGYFIFQAIVGVLLLFLWVFPIGLLLAALGMFGAYWSISNFVPRRVLKGLMTKMGGQAGFAPPPAYVPPAAAPYQPPAAPPAYTPPPVSAAPPATPVAPPPAPVTTSGGADPAAIMEQIKQLAALRDAGALTAEEFDAKKAELLARI